MDDADGRPDTAEWPCWYMPQDATVASEDDSPSCERAVAVYLMQVSRLCGDISRLADIEQVMAVECRRLAERDVPRSAKHLAAAAEADRFAAHKRAEQRRWQLP